MKEWNILVQDIISEFIDTVEGCTNVDIDFIDIDEIARNIHEHAICYDGCSCDENSNYPIVVAVYGAGCDVCIECEECGTVIYSLEVYLSGMDEEVC